MAESPFFTASRHDVEVVIGGKEHVEPATVRRVGVEHISRAILTPVERRKTELVRRSNTPEGLTVMANPFAHVELNTTLLYSDCALRSAGHLHPHDIAAAPGPGLAPDRRHYCRSPSVVGYRVYLEPKTAY